MFIIYNNNKLLLYWHQSFYKISSFYKKFKDHCISVPPYILPVDYVNDHWFVPRRNLCFETQSMIKWLICVLHEVEERVCDEMINVSDNVHSDEVETASFRQVVLLLDIDLQQFVVMKEEQVVTEK